MRIIISADMEGISGVVNWDQVTPGHYEYQRFRKIMTEEVNAAIAGCLKGGATEIVVTDGHWDGLNLLVEDLDPRARLNSGSGSPLSMVQGIENGADGMIFIGYHARSGSQNAVLAHTWSASRVANVWLNDVLVGEYGLNAALAGHYKIPVIMVTGDQTACEQTIALLGSMQASIVKIATGFASADCQSPVVSQKQIITDAAAAVRDQIKNPRKPYVVEEPVRIVIEFLQPLFADRAEKMSGSKRLDACRVEIICSDMVKAHTAFRAAVRLSAD